jgi:arylsulfatase A-like enzyme
MATDRPNILLIIADDLGIDTFHIDDANDKATVQLTGTDSYPLPTLSRLVANGLHITRAWAQPICAPTRATLFTGMHPWRTNIGDAAGDPILSNQLPADETIALQTLANVVADAGYQCSIFGKWDLGHDHDTGVPTARGWHRHEGILEGGLRFINQDPPNRAAYEQIIQQDVRYISWEKVVGDACLGIVRENITPEERTHKYATADEIFAARDWIKHVEGCPWWVTLSLLAPHDPFHVPPQGTYTIQFKDPANPTIQEMFVAMLESMDYYLGQLFDDPSPEIQNQLKNTIIIFMGDNGSQDELDLVEGDDKSSVYIGGVHVPLLITDGGAMVGDAPCYLAPDRVSSEKPHFVHIVDLFQTITDIVGGTAPAYPLDSISLLPYLRDTTSDSRFANWQARTYNFGQFFVPSDIPQLAGRYKALGECATISDGKYKLNYQNGKYEFSELFFDPTTDLTTERVTNDFKHPKAQELWKRLTTPGTPEYAEMDGKGNLFPVLTGDTIVGPQLVGIRKDNQLCYRETLTGEWVEVPNSGSVIAITVLPDGRLLGAGSDNQLWYREYLNSEWVQVPNSGSVIGITVLPDGKIVCVGTDHQLWYRETLTSEWVQVCNSGSVIDITTMPNDRILGVGTDHQLYIWNRDYLTSTWSHVPNSGAAISITVLPDRKFVCVGTDNQLWYRNNINSEWVQVPNSGPVISITTGTNVKRYREYT